ncbi:MAG: DNA-binding protein WhiA [Ruminococcaceae bacterium]|nr:DNA-binding protein WhiA [Oscillospiraceae bacterium]
MSFAKTVKDELIEKSILARRISGQKPCCIHAENYGMFLFARAFEYKKICIKTENETITSLYSNYAQNMTGKRPDIEKSKAGKYTVSVRTQEERDKILDTFGHTGKEINRRLNRANLEEDCCMSSLIRGAFLACGTMTNPAKDYHLEFVIPHKTLCDDLKKLMNESDNYPKYVLRKGVHILYFKDSEHVEDILTFMGATDASLEVMGIKMYKSIRNKVNRRMNFENANASRAFEAAYRQIAAIRFIEETKGLGFLQGDLLEVAKLRMENIEYTLNDIAENLKEPLSKSGVNHRLRKIIETAENLGWEG